MVYINKILLLEIEIVFLVIFNEYSFLSSSVVKEIVIFGGLVDYFVF